MKLIAWKEQEESVLNKIPSKKDHHHIHALFTWHFGVRIVQLVLV